MKRERQAVEIDLEVDFRREPAARAVCAFRSRYFLLLRAEYPFAAVDLKSSIQVLKKRQRQPIVVCNPWGRGAKKSGLRGIDDF